MRLIGIDPGNGGGLVLLDTTDPVGLVAITDMPTLAGRVDCTELVTTLTNWGQVDRVFIEDVHAVAQAGSSSSFKFGRAVGALDGVLAALQRPVQYVTPNEWTRHHRVGKDKEAHVRRARELWPASADTFLKSKDGRADAALIAAFGVWRLREVLVGGA